MLKPKIGVLKFHKDGNCFFLFRISLHWQQITFVFFWASNSSLVIKPVFTCLPQLSQKNCTSATLWLDWRTLRGSYFPSFVVLSFANKFSTYSLMVRFVSLALFLMSSWTLSVTVIHLYPFLGKMSNLPSVLYGTLVIYNWRCCMLPTSSMRPPIMKPYINVKRLSQSQKLCN